ncbi:hypothetical protein [Nocardioides kribbensis]|uniref:Uncharacterized protein n=1 Tax=Nocardioides kribbensis TaxID=305517 RepID=A0ABV1NZ03_9ACTN
MRERAEVRLNRRKFSGTWEVVRLAKDGRTITDRWPIHPDDAAWLDEVTTPTQTDERGSDE